MLDRDMKSATGSMYTRCRACVCTYLVIFVLVAGAGTAEDLVGLTPGVVAGSSMSGMWQEQRLGEACDDQSVSLITYEEQIYKINYHP